MPFNPKTVNAFEPPVVFAPPDPEIFAGWENFEAPPPPAPCRVIQVTDEMRSRDARERAARDKSVAANWRQRVAPASKPVAEKPGPIPGIDRREVVSGELQPRRRIRPEPNAIAGEVMETPASPAPLRRLPPPVPVNEMCVELPVMQEPVGVMRTKPVAMQLPPEDMLAARPAMPKPLYLELQCSIELPLSDRPTVDVSKLRKYSAEENLFPPIVPKDGARECFGGCGRKVRRSNQTGFCCFCNKAARTRPNDARYKTVLAAKSWKSTRPTRCGRGFRSTTG